MIMSSTVLLILKNDDPCIIFILRLGFLLKGLFSNYPMAIRGLPILMARELITYKTTPS